MKDPAADSRILYSDILNDPHPVSRRHHPMSRLNRAAQFSPFAALTGYEDGRVSILCGKKDRSFEKTQVAQVRLHVTI